MNDAEASSPVHWKNRKTPLKISHVTEGPPGHSVDFRVGAVHIILQTSPSPFTDANKLIIILTFTEFVELRLSPKYIPKSTSLESCHAIVFLSQFCQFVCSRREGFGLKYALSLRKTDVQMEMIDFVSFQFFSDSNTDLSNYELIGYRHEKVSK